MKQRVDVVVCVVEVDVEELKVVVDVNEIDFQCSMICFLIDGVVLECCVDLGQIVVVFFQLLVFFKIGQDLCEMDFVVYVVEVDVSCVVLGQWVMFIVDVWFEVDFEVMVCKVSFGLQMIENVVSYEVVFVVDNVELCLWLGMIVMVVICVVECNGVFVVFNVVLCFWLLV